MAKHCLESDLADTTTRRFAAARLTARLRAVEASRGGGRRKQATCLRRVRLTPILRRAAVAVMTRTVRDVQ